MLCGLDAPGYEEEEPDEDKDLDVRREHAAAGPAHARFARRGPTAAAVTAAAAASISSIARCVSWLCCAPTIPPPRYTLCRMSGYTCRGTGTAPSRRQRTQGATVTPRSRWGSRRSRSDPGGAAGAAGLPHSQLEGEGHATCAPRSSLRRRRRQAHKKKKNNHSPAQSARCSARRGPRARTPRSTPAWPPPPPGMPHAATARRTPAASCGERDGCERRQSDVVPKGSTL